MLQHSLIVPLLVLLVLASSGSRVTGNISDGICFGHYDNEGTKCSHFSWETNATQERVFKTFKYDVFEHGSGDFCVPFDIRTGKNQTLTVYSYFACNYSDSVDEKACVRCRNRGIRALRKQCRNNTGAVARSEHCCLRYETYNMCTDRH
ncbi:hypothetical protein LINGRAHAP2_LOCUS8837 [Linum grandiflorum]